MSSSGKKRYVGSPSGRRSVGSPSGKLGRSWLFAAGLLALLLMLASLQFKWLNEVSRADREKSRDLLRTAVARFAEDFDRELTRAFLYFQPHLFAASSLRDDGTRDLEGFADKFERWQTYAPFPELVGDIYLALRGEDGVVDVTRFDPAEGAFLPSAWPAELEPLHERLAAEPRRHRHRGEPRGAGFSILADEIPALILPMPGIGPFGLGPSGEARHPRRFRSPRGSSEVGPNGERPDRVDEERFDDHRFGRPGRPPIPGPYGVMILRLDLESIRDVILPQLSQRHLHAGANIEYEARVVSLRDQQLIFRRGGVLEQRDSEDGDASIGLFGLLPPDKLGTLELEAGLRRGPETRSPDQRPGVEPSGDRHSGRRLREGFLYHRLYSFVSAEGSAASASIQGNTRWRLVASHPAGSLDAAVATAHRRNLAISFGILLLLGASLLLMLLSTRRIQALARQQLEFVAGVTHELLTPLAAMRSAGQNLADGVVAEPKQVQRYGRLVEDEGRRLSTMVEQVLEFAGIQAGGRSYALARTQLAPVIDSALAEYRSVLEEKGVQLDKTLAPELPDVMADAVALRRAVQNLIVNAVKYGAQGVPDAQPDGEDAGGVWIGLRAVVDDGPAGKELRLSVEDKGPGIAAVDLPHLFEPFYRGKNGSASAIPGSGLGLSLVQHIVEGHGGRLTVVSEEGAGSMFTIHLPAVAGRSAGDMLGGDDER